jgi:uncharacterized membrane-anchored protein YhcB (DUF1043 family)
MKNVVNQLEMSKSKLQLNRAKKQIKEEKLLTNCFKLSSELTSFRKKYGISTRLGLVQTLLKSLESDTKLQDQFIKEIDDIKNRWDKGRQIVIKHNLGNRWNYQDNPVREYSKTFQGIENGLTKLLDLKTRLKVKTDAVPTSAGSLTKKMVLTPEDSKRLMAKLHMIELECYVRGVITDLHYSQIFDKK